MLRQATVVPVANLDLARAMLTRGELSAFATNKGILNEMADRVAGARVLDGRWGEEHLAIAVPKARPAAGNTCNGSPARSRPTDDCRRW